MRLLWSCIVISLLAGCARDIAPHDTIEPTFGSLDSIINCYNIMAIKLQSARWDRVIQMKLHMDEADQLRHINERYNDDELADIIKVKQLHVDNYISALTSAEEKAFLAKLDTAHSYGL